ncbi:hypothetical protein [Maricaulis sp.]|uniref:hypothetical protein n=1 Tax=Maricaulis sp. TaxID=1486257 RepID=UPI0025B9EEF1|nr:hypothetical protein [Maricaulis sp.]
MSEKDWAKVPYSDDFILHEKSIGAVSISPAAIAERLQLECDQGCDDLDQFDILILQRDHERVGFLRHRGSPAAFSGVCSWSNDVAVRMPDVLSSILPRLGDEFVAYGEPW